MASQNNIYPLFFTLERVRNGYILTAKEETGGLKEAEFRKEVVSEDKINARIGQMLHLDAMVKERPVVFHVEAVGESTYQMANERSSDELTEAKLAYVHINSKDIKDGSILSLLIKDTDSIEVYGFEAERAAKSNNIPLFRVNPPILVSFYLETLLQTTDNPWLRCNSCRSPECCDFPRGLLQDGCSCVFCY